jgi:hypothetical protein
VGTFAIGQTITCQPGGLVGAANYVYTMYRDTNRDGSKGKTEPVFAINRESYTVTVTDVANLTSVDLAKGVSIGCSARARGEGGYGDFSGPVTVIPVSRPTAPSGDLPAPEAPAPPATPAPTPAPAVDKKAPQLSKRAAVCSTTSCRVSIIALDPGVGAQGVKSMSAKLTIKRRSTCRVKSGKNKGKMRACTKTITKSVKLSRTGDQWIAKLTGLRKKDKLSLKFTGTDRAGNRAALTIAPKLRTSR